MKYILLAECDQARRDLVEAMLQDQGHQVGCAVDVEIIVRILRATSLIFDAIVIGMRPTAQRFLITAIRQVSATPIVALGHSIPSENDQRHGTVDAYVAGDAIASDLSEAIDGLIARRRARNQVFRTRGEIGLLVCAR